MITPVVKPRHGIITQVNPSNKTISILTEKGYSGIDSINFFVKDYKNEKSNTSTISYMINCPWSIDTKNLKRPFDKNADIGYRLYSDNGLDIKFYYPIEWNVSKSMKQEYELKPYKLAYTLNPVKINPEVVNPNLQILIAPLSGNSFKTVLESASASNLDQNYETPKFTGILFNDRCASEETIENTQEQYGKVKAYSIKILIDDVIYNFLYWAQTDQFDKYLPKILKIIGSIEVV